MTPLPTWPCSYPLDQKPKKHLTLPQPHPNLFDGTLYYLLDPIILKKFKNLEKKVDSLAINSAVGTHTVKASSTFYDYEINEIFNNVSLDDKYAFCKAIGISSHGLAMIDIVSYGVFSNQSTGISPIMYNVTLEKYVDKIPF